MTNSHVPPPLTRRGGVVLLSVGLVRALAWTSLLLAAYYLLPLDDLTGWPIGVVLVGELVLLVSVAALQLWLIIRANHPQIQAYEALAATTPLFLLLFATAYFVISTSHPGSFSQYPLTRSDTLYFTVTVFSTVGFGDISATSQSTRLLVTGQMILNLLFLGLGLRVFLGAVKVARKRHPGGTASPPSP